MFVERLGKYIPASSQWAIRI